MSPSSSTVVSVTTSKDHFRESEAMITGDYCDSSTSSSSPMTQAFPFSSGNPRIEETRGVMHLFSNDGVSGLPVGRKPSLSVLGVPNHMTYADFCQFCASFLHHILEMRIVRNDGMEEQYSILIRFDCQDSTDRFYQHFNGRQFNSLEEDVCRVLFIVDVQFTGYSGSLDTQPSLASTTEQPSCPVCLEKLDQDMGGILTTICNHSFHCSCISKWEDSSCPVCRYCQQQPEKSICFVCQTSDNLWLCVICGFVGCGSYKGGHATRHWKETQHCYSLELETQRVWDYVGDNYVHRLIQSKTDGKLVELNSHCVHGNDGCASCVSLKSGVSDALFNGKVEAIVNEYNELLATQLENQKLYFETLLQKVNEETEREISEAVKKAVAQKLQKLQAKLDRCLKEKKFLDELNENLLKNQDIWKTKILEIEESKGQRFPVPEMFPARKRPDMARRRFGPVSLNCKNQKCISNLRHAFFFKKKKSFRLKHNRQNRAAPQRRRRRRGGLTWQQPRLDHRTAVTAAQGTLLNFCSSIFSSFLVLVWERELDPFHSPSTKGLYNHINFTVGN